MLTHGLDATASRPLGYLKGSTGVLTKELKSMLRKPLLQYKGSIRKLKRLTAHTIYQCSGKALREGLLQRQQAVGSEVGLLSRLKQALQVRGHNSAFSGVA
jgi:hypothetical protein